jgi:hypothetical protein
MRFRFSSLVPALAVHDSPSPLRETPDDILLYDLDIRESAVSRPATNDGGHHGTGV